MRCLQRACSYRSQQLIRHCLPTSDLRAQGRQRNDREGSFLPAVPALCAMQLAAPQFAFHSYRKPVTASRGATQTLTLHQTLISKQPLMHQQRQVRTGVGLASSTETSKLGPVGKSWWLLVPVAVGLATVPFGGFNLIEMYNKALQAHPIQTKMATGVTGAFLGDLAAQALPVVLHNTRAWRDGLSARDYQLFSWDPWRAGRFMLFSAVLATPCAVAWFGFLDKVVMPDNPTAIPAVATKVALDQLFMSPIMTGIFFMTMATLQGKGSEALQQAQTKLWPTMKLNYALWPLAHVINFSLVPSDQRILYINCVAIIWSVILSTMAASPPQGAQQHSQRSRSVGLADTQLTIHQREGSPVRPDK